MFHPAGLPKESAKSLGNKLFILSYPQKGILPENQRVFSGFVTSLLPSSTENEHINVPQEVLMNVRIRELHFPVYVTENSFL